MKNSRYCFHYILVLILFGYNIIELIHAENDCIFSPIFPHPTLYRISHLNEI
uniref:Uncharacterized protein n=1 Tax=Heterorhabditis bacteriophora TaxID=37862 RepID=A0A1I7WIF8_HETBA